MDSDFTIKVAKETRRLVDANLVRETFGAEAGIDRLPEAKLRLLLRQMEATVRILRLAEICRQSFVCSLVAEPAGQEFLQMVGGVEAAIESLAGGDSLSASGLLMTEKEARAYIKSIGWRHYVYGLCLSDGTVFYVGKGVQDRMLQHKVEARANGSSAKCQQILAAGDDLRYTVFLSCQDDCFAAGYESHLILRHGKSLTNIASGSEKLLEQMFTGANASGAAHEQKARELFLSAAEEVLQAQRRVAALLIENKGLMASMDEADIKLFSLDGVNLT